MKTTGADTDTNDLEIIWGAKEIGRRIGRTERQTYHLLKTGQLRGARKKGGRWYITMRDLMANFQPDDAAAMATRQLVDRLSPKGREASLLARLSAFQWTSSKQ